MIGAENMQQLNAEGFITLEKRVELLPYKPRSFIEREFLTDAELLSNVGKDAYFDIEIYPNYCLISFKIAGKYLCLECDEFRNFNAKMLSWIMFNYRTVGFNSIKFDLLILWLAYHNQNTEVLKDAANAIIQQGMGEWELKKEYDFQTFKTAHIDLIEVAPLTGSLKLYMARLHAPRIQELPFPDTMYLDNEQKEIVKYYNFNDLDGTQLLAEFMQERLDLRAAMSIEYREDLMSKSDAQMAEIVLSKEIGKLNGKKLERPEISKGPYYYNCPAFLNFVTPAMQKFLEVCKKAKFFVNDNGYLDAPEGIDTYLTIGDMNYSFGIGGLHSKEKCIAYKANEEYKLTDRDVTSYYPNCILNLGLFPIGAGPNFLTVFKGFKDERVTAKRAKNFTKDKGLKIFLNGTSGKFSDRWSKLRSPQLTMQMNLTCQLSILMLVEMLHCNGFKIVSANTDGVTIWHRRDEQEKLDYWIKYWEQLTGFDTEETEYKSYHGRDVNAYFALKTDGKIKKKGPYSEVGSQSGTKLDTNPFVLICSDAVEALLKDGIPIEATIRYCNDFTRFIAVRNAKSPGAHKNRQYLGKVLRWYYAKGEIGTIQTVAANNTVAMSEGAKPCMDLPESFPEDINYQWYINKTKEILIEIGYLAQAKQIAFFLKIGVDLLIDAAMLCLSKRPINWSKSNDLLLHHSQR
jgi:hypothetical protein